jgi:hypothetical protein
MNALKININNTVEGVTGWGDRKISMFKVLQSTTTAYFCTDNREEQYVTLNMHF